MPTYKAKVKSYNTNQGDIWDLIALFCYGDEHAMNAMQDANFDYRYTDFFSADVVLVVPEQVTLEVDLKFGTTIPNLGALLPWR